MRYVVAKILFAIRFPGGGLSACDMRPTHEAFLVNVHVLMKLKRTASDTRALAYEKWAQMFRWVQMISWLFARADRIQFVVGTREPPRQLLKGWAPVNRISEADPHNLKANGANLSEMVDWETLAVE